MAFINSHYSANCAPCTPFALINLYEIDRLNSLPSSAIRVYLSIATHANRAGTCWPGRKRISEQTNLNREQVSKATSILSMVGLIEKVYRENGSIVYQLPYHQSGPVHEPDSGLSIRFTPAPGSPWSQLPDAPEPEPIPPGVRIDTPPCQTRHPEPIIESNPRTERAEPERTTPEPVEQAPLSLLRSSIKTPPPDALPESWLQEARTLNPSIPDEQWEQSAERFLNLQRARGTVLIDWRPVWMNWAKQERSPKASVASPSKQPPKVETTSSPYTGWEAGKPRVNPIDGDAIIAAFERDMIAMGAVKDSNGVWRRPGPSIIPAPLPRPMINLAALAETPAPVAVEIDANPAANNGASEVPAVEIEPNPAPAPIVEIVQTPARRSPLAGVLDSLRRDSCPDAGKPASVPWRRPVAAIIDPAELAEAEALLAAEVAQKRQGG